jgi:hypothetical protein
MKVDGTTPPPRQRPKTAQQHDFTDDINGLLQLISTPLVIAGTNQPAYLADAMAVSHHSPQIASALNDLAKQRPEIAAVLHRILAAGPYAALITAIIPLAVQILTNHGGIPLETAMVLGAQDPMSLIPQRPPDEPEPSGNGDFPDPIRVDMT